MIYLSVIVYYYRIGRNCFVNHRLLGAYLTGVQKNFFILM
jgi:hypothetical protein